MVKKEKFHNYLLHETYENFPTIFLLDINECLANNGGCSVNAQCINVMGGPRICTCNAGYTGDGFNCTGENAMFLKIFAFF